MDFGKRFKFYRQRVNLTQKDAAEKIGVKDYQLGNYETNRSQPSLEVLKKMSKTYAVSIDVLLGNNIVSKKYDGVFEETDDDGYIDMDELAASLNEIVEKINKAKKQ